MSTPPPSPTLVLTRADVAGLMDAAAWLAAAEAGFKAAATGNALAPTPMTIPGVGGSFHAKGARMALDRHYVALKFNGNFPENPSRLGLPTIQGAMFLCDGTTGALLAVIDSIEVTLRRTAAATALAARYLARPESHRLLICGCGDQGAAQLDAIRGVLPIEQILVWDIDPLRSRAFAERYRQQQLTIDVATGLSDACLASDVIITCTTANRAFLESAFIGPGTFVAAVGADSPSKSEIAPALMQRSLVVADVLHQCAVMGDLHHAIAAGVMDQSHIHAELSDLVSGAKEGRTNPDQITLFDSTGTALQDVAAAAMIYERATAAGGYHAVEFGRLA